MSYFSLQNNEKKTNDTIKNNLSKVTETMIENTNKLADEMKLINGELNELIEIENEIKQIESSNLNKKNELINLERKLNENKEENNE